MVRTKERARGLTPVQAVFLQYERAIKRVIGRIVRSPADTEDVAQDVFLRVVAAERRTPIINAKAYMFEAARNAAMTECSKRSRRILQTIEATTEQAIDFEPSAEAVLIAKERLTLFCEAIMHLPPQCRAVFIMSKVRGRSYRDIATTLGIAESTVEKHVSAGLSRCAEYIRLRELADAPAVSEVRDKRVRSR